MTTPAPPIPESTRKSQHDELQAHLGGIADRYSAVATGSKSGPSRAMARLMGSYVGTVASKAKAVYKAGGNPSVDSHMAILASAEKHLAAIGAPAGDGGPASAASPPGPAAAATAPVA